MANTIEIPRDNWAVCFGRLGRQAQTYPVRIEVENTGTIPPEIRDTIFSPFVRSADSSRGTGLGLYIVEQIAKAHGGSVSVRTSEGTTVFEVLLPRHFASRTAAIST